MEYSDDLSPELARSWSAAFQRRDSMATRSDDIAFAVLDWIAPQVLPNSPLQSRPRGPMEAYHPVKPVAIEHRFGVPLFVS